MSRCTYAARGPAPKAGSLASSLACTPLPPAPCAAMQGTLSTRADMFSVGVMLWEFACGQVAYL